MARRAYYLSPDRVTVISMVPELIRKDMVAGVYIAEAAPPVKGTVGKNGKPYTYFRLEREPEATSIGASVQLIDTKINDSTDIRALAGDMQPVPIPADAIADDLVRMCSDSAHLASWEAKPAIVKLEDDQEEPTEEQITDALERQEVYARRVVLEARQLVQLNKMDQIRDSHYVWAKWMGLGDDPFKIKEKTGEVKDEASATLSALVLAQQRELAEMREMMKSFVAAPQAIPPPLSPTQPKAVK